MPGRSIVVDCRRHGLDDLLGREWLLPNRIGAYASSTVVGCNTRRYHGLLVAATKPPVGRLLALAQVGEQLVVGGETFDLSTFEFPDTISPRGFTYLEEFRDEAATTFRFRLAGLELTKEVILAESANVVAIRYALRGGQAELHLRPFAALRDFHGLRKAHEPHLMAFEAGAAEVVVRDGTGAVPPLHLSARPGSFAPRGQWWYRFHYRADQARGQECLEDLYSPGTFVVPLADGASCQLTASLGDPCSLDFDDAVARRRGRADQLAAAMGPGADLTTRRLAVATDDFLVRRHLGPSVTAWTILAGYHWFADWGRDAFIALPGLLLCTGRLEEARAVFRLFAEHISEGMVPNCFDDYAPTAHYNSMDASLWFIVAAERYLQATGDAAFWRSTLQPAAAAILAAYQAGTRFGIHADSDGLLTGGSYKTQLTWMDAKLGEEAITPRHGKPVEINALWHSAHRIVARRSAEIDPALADRCRTRAETIAAAFNRLFWNDQAGCLFDCISDGRADGSIRPNQILAVSLPYSPLPPRRQAAVVAVVREKLLTPVGLRTLSSDDPRYRGRYGGSWESRDRAYHQGTVWAWLIGPFIEAYLTVEQFRPPAVAAARQWLAAFDVHLEMAGAGSISEIFDGDPPHEPRGCIAQAWSVGEVLRAKRMADQSAKRNDAR